MGKTSPWEAKAVGNEPVKKPEPEPPQTCANCRHSIPASAYPLLNCLFMQEFTRPDERCVRWQK